MLPIPKQSLEHATPLTIPASAIRHILAHQPLEFDKLDQSRNEAIIKAVMIALETKNGNDQTIVIILANAHNHGYQAELNELIRLNIDKNGGDTVFFNTSVIDALQLKGIECAQEDDGSVKMGLFALPNSVVDGARSDAINETLRLFMPETISDIISCYDGQLKICEENESEIITILMSGDLSEKRQIFSAASQQGEIVELNRILRQIEKEGRLLDLSGIDLNGLNLRSIYFSGVYLDNANLMGADLTNATLAGSTLRNANLHKANLTAVNFRNETDLTSADLSEATLTFANMTDAVLVDTNLTDANMTSAWLYKADMTRATLTGANLCKANLSFAMLVDITMMAKVRWDQAEFYGTEMNDITLQNLPAKLRGQLTEHLTPR